MQQSITTLAQHTNVVIDCASSDGAEALLTWLRQSPRGNIISVRLPSLRSDQSPTARQLTGELLSLGCSVTLLRPRGNT
jgi:DNA recombination-dependent growth factor C